MKKLTIKLKITLWFTVFMMIVSAVVFAFIAFVSSSAASSQNRGALTGLVDDNAREVQYDHGEIEIDDDFVSFRNGIYCLVFNSRGETVNGYAPYAELERMPFEDRRIRSAQVNGENHLVYDRVIVSKKHGDIWIRGIVSESGSAVTSSAVYSATLIALPLLILLAAVGGYLLAGRSLRPIKKIGQTAEDIGSSGDLSKRIEMGGSADELHRLAGTFNRMFERLQLNFEAERNFTSDASHELRTPITTILAQCEYAFENAAGEQELYEAIGAIQRQGYRMSHLIESLLQFTRMEQQTDRVTFETIDFSAVVAAACNEQKKNDEKGIVLTQEIQPDIRLKADASMMFRMLDNLIKNACRYGKENGKIQVCLKETANQIILSVADDGIGIAAAEQPKIWNRFYRADKSRSSAQGVGLGLGLAMVKQIAELHGGSVQLDSEIGKGSIFTVYFASK